MDTLPVKINPPFTVLDAQGIKHSFPKRNTITLAHLSCQILYYTCMTGPYIAVVDNDAAPMCMECISRVLYK